MSEKQTKPKAPVCVTAPSTGCKRGAAVNSPIGMCAYHDDIRRLMEPIMQNFSRSLQAWVLQQISAATGKRLVTAEEMKQAAMAPLVGPDGKPL